MQLLLTAITSSLVSVIFLCLIYFYLFILYKDRFLLIWSLCWLICASRFSLDLIFAQYFTQPYLIAATSIATLLAALFLAWGVYLFGEQKIPNYHFSIFLVLVGWIGIGTEANIPFFWITLPVFTIIGSLYIWAGILFLKNSREYGRESIIAGAAFVILGFHHMDYPFLRPFEWAAPYGYFLATFLYLMIAIGTLLAFFHKTNRDLKIREQQYASLLHGGLDGFFIIDTNGRLLQVNTMLSTMCTISTSELVHMNINELQHRDDPTSLTISQACAQGIQRFETCLKKGENSRLDVEITVQPDNPTPHTYTGYIRDISERKAAEEKVRISEEKYRFLFDKAADPLYIMDKFGVIVHVNEQACAHTGYTKEEMIGEHILKIDGHFTTKADIENIHDQLKKDTALTFETYHRHKDGTRMPVEIRTTLIRQDKDKQALSVVRDISDRKQAEAEQAQLQARLQHAHKLESIGTLAGGIAHDFNNILTSILGYAEIGVEDCKKNSDLNHYFTMIIESSTRAKELVQQILAFSRQSITHSSAFSPVPLFKETLKILRPSIPATIDIRLNIDDDIPYIEADPSQFSQVIMNLCTNAFHAMEEHGGTLSMTLRKTFLPPEHSDSGGDPTKEYILLSIHDTGTGIEASIRGKIFDPYFTTKDTGKGTGMGLAIVHGIVKNCSGHISCESTPENGTTFDIYLPAAKKLQPEKQDAPGNIQGGSEHILLVDDEPQILSLHSIILDRLGYKTTSCKNGRTALESFTENPDHFDAIFTDQTMPEMTGLELAHHIHKIDPQMPIILYTGYSSTVTREKALAAGIDAYLTKPVTKQQLAPILRKLIDQRSLLESQTKKA